jgi:hypothetical protein
MEFERSLTQREPAALHALASVTAATPMLAFPAFSFEMKLCMQYCIEASFPATLI